jgi:hypothetical protein
MLGNSHVLENKLLEQLHAGLSADSICISQKMFVSSHGRKRHNLSEPVD